MCANYLSKVALDSAAAGIEPTISSRKFNALTTTPPSHITSYINYLRATNNVVVFLVIKCNEKM